MGGTVALNGGNPNFTPDANFNGLASFDYWISDVSNLPGPGMLVSPNTFSTGFNPVGVAAGDLDGDGVIDLVVSNGGGNTLRYCSGMATATSGTRFRWVRMRHPVDHHLRPEPGRYRRPDRVQIEFDAVFADSTAVLGASTDVNGGALITASDGSTLFLAGLTVQQLQASQDHLVFS